jgi:CRP/FNR family transcriptional regulator, cyclic AMP receptor protein
MQTPYGLKIVERCTACEQRAGRFFCDLSERALCEVDAIRFATVYPKGALLFVEGQPPRGVYLLCSGRVKLSTTSSDARVIITRIVEPGEILGLCSTLAGEPYEVTAETAEPCQVSFMRREDFLRFLAANSEASLRVAAQLSSNYRAALEQVRLLGLSHSAAGKFARFLLERSNRHDRTDSSRQASGRADAQPNGREAASGQGEGHTNGTGRANGRALPPAQIYGAGTQAACASAPRPDRLTLTLTHEEIGQLIGASRETVTRLFSEFKSERLIQVKGSTLLLYNRHALEALANR